ncbi:hypothetical protein FHS15_005721 [Paenibacillus castaneae]|uniref:hypothetical protein n=1 Tax=Paenibacillus castaneae TaxID=474957 RepID=UPI00141A6834|nr:hypothetical protein [Paenibacillus castaneae]NIK80531.1 hypothetical protein [Paenibacillus castaneae]
MDLATFISVSIPRALPSSLVFALGLIFIYLTVNNVRGRNFDEGRIWGIFLSISHLLILAVTQESLLIYVSIIVIVLGLLSFLTSLPFVLVRLLREKKGNVGGRRAVRHLSSNYATEGKMGKDKFKIKP